MSQWKGGPWHPSSRGAEAVLSEISIFGSWQWMALEKFQIWSLLVILEGTCVQASHWKRARIFPFLPFLYENHFLKHFFFHRQIKIHFLIITANTSFKWEKLSSDRQHKTVQHKTVQHICTNFTWKVHHYFIFLLAFILENHLCPLLWWSGCHIRHYLQNQTYWLIFILFYSHSSC